MDDVCTFLGVVGLLILGITLVGHLLWLMFAALFRGLRSARASEPPKLGDIGITLHTLTRLHAEHRISTRTYHEVWGALSSGPAVASKPKPIPVAPAPVPPERLPVEAAPQPPGATIAPPPLRVRPIAAAPPPLQIVKPAPKRRRPLAEVLSAFMHDSNIRWGELVGALLIIGCSIALVRTFWETIRTYDWLRFFVLNSTTVAVFATGLYTERRWKLPATSRGLLLTASLLVPLNFMAMAFARTDSTLTLLGEFSSVAVFGLLLYLAGAILTPGLALPTTLAILGASATQLLVNRFHPHPILAVIPTLLFCGAPLAALLRRRDAAPATLLTLLGSAAFATLLSLAFLLYRSTAPAATLRQLAPLFTLLALPLLAIGLSLWIGLKEAALNAFRIAGTAIALAGAGLLITFLVLAWPTAWAAPLFLVYAVAFFAIAGFAGLPHPTWAGLALAGLALGRLLLYPDHLSDPHTWALGLLIYASVTTLFSIAGRFIRLPAALADPVADASLLLTALAAIPLTRGITHPEFAYLATRLLWLSGLLLSASVLRRSRTLFVLFQSAATLSATAAAFALLLLPFAIQARTAQSVGIAVALVTLLWPLLRLVTRRQPALAAFLPPQNSSLDAVIPFGLVSLLVVLTVAAAGPGIAREFSTALELPAAVIPASAGTGSFLLLLGVAAVIALQLAQRPSRTKALLLAFCTVLLPPLLAAHHPSAVASAYRWLSALYLLLSAGPLLIQQERPRMEDARALTLTAGLLPILLLTLYPAALTLSGQSIAGPGVSSFFRAHSNALNYLLPLGIVIATLLAYAARLRSPGFALAASLILNLSISLAYVLPLTTALDVSHAITLLHLNAIAFAAFAFAWIALLAARSALRPLPWQIVPLAWLAGICFLLVLIPAESTLLTRVAPAAFDAARPLGYAAFLLCAGLAIAVTRVRTGRVPVGLVFVLLLAAGSMACLSAHGEGERARWTALLILLLSRAMAGWVLLALGFLASARFSFAEAPDVDVLAGQTSAGPIARLLGWTDFQQPITLYTLLCGILTLLLSFHLLPHDLNWCIIGLAAAATLSVGLAAWTLRSECLYATGILILVAVNVRALHVAAGTFDDLAQLNILALAAAGLATFLFELLVLRPQRGEVVRTGLPAFHRVAAAISVILLFVFNVRTTALDLSRFFRTTPLDPLAVTTLAAVTLLALIRLWDIDSRRVLPTLYLQGLTLCLFLLHLYAVLVEPLRGWHPLFAVTAFALLTSYLYAIRHALLRLGQSLRIPARDGWPADSPSWLSPSTGIIAAGVCAVAFLVVLFHRNLDQRLIASACAVAAAVSLGLLARDAAAHRLKQISLLLLASTAILWGWAWLDPHSRNRLLDLLAVTMGALGLMSAVYSAILMRFLPPQNPWTTAARSLAPALGALTASALLAILVLEVTGYRDGVGSPISFPAIAAVAAALIALLAAALVCALVPGKDPLDLSLRGRTAYVYAAEALLVLFFVHLRLTIPELFAHRLFERYWPAILMALAFLAVGLSELFQRRQTPVLAQPLQNTGVLLPLLPVVGFFLAPTAQQHLDYTLILVLAGFVYALLAILRQSFFFGVLAALAGNGALWRFFSTHNIAFLSHPQLYLIPAAASVLLAAWIHRERLSPDALARIRYTCLIVIYASSTSDIFLNNLQQAPYLPIILALLSAAGVLSGIILRIQSFLFLGSTFLAISLATLVYYASGQAHSNWPWLVAGILLGIGIVVLFALFEKRRPQLLALIDGLKEWQA